MQVKYILIFVSAKINFSTDWILKNPLNETIFSFYENLIGLRLNRHVKFQHICNHELRYC